MTTSRQSGWTPDASTFGMRLAMVRQAMGWGNVAEAAAACGIPIATWRNWERDGREPRSLITAAMKIAGVTGIDYRWLALGPETPVSAPVGAEVSATRGYRPMGERLIARIDPGGLPSGRTGVRTRPIELRIPA